MRRATQQRPAYRDFPAFVRARLTIHLLRRLRLYTIARWQFPFTQSYGHIKMKRRTFTKSVVFGAAMGWAAISFAQEAFKIGLILPMTGPFASTGRQIDTAVRLYMQEHGDTV